MRNFSQYEKEFGQAAQYIHLAATQDLYSDRTEELGLV
jgi:hypothetical protein